MQDPPARGYTAMQLYGPPAHHIHRQGTKDTKKSLVFQNPSGKNLIHVRISKPLLLMTQQFAG